MPIKYHIDKANQVVISYAPEILSEADFVDHFQRLQGDKDFHSGYNHLFDCCAVKKFNIDRESIGRIVQLKLFAPNSKRAILTARELSYGLARMYELYRNIPSDQIQVFRDKSAACNWLGLSSAASST